jgi:alkanesulfonate monooxygenase SsuD/methylene tetrahydromethanopterin reductase-like flavin-dependent oxidoreductase (luciferase family)
VRFGLQLPEVERRVGWPEYVSLARAAEAAGFDSIWMGDHLLYAPDERPERGPWEAWTLLAGLAASTERVRLGPLVACAAFHPPGVLAKMAATVAEVSGGRFVLGFGAGWNEPELRAFGLPTDRLVSRFAEAFEIVHRLLGGERVTLDGEFWRADGAVLLPPLEHQPELMVGATGPRMLRLALPHVDAWNTWYAEYGNRAEGFAALNERVTAAARDAGRDPAAIRRSACAFVVLDRAAGERPIAPDAPPLEGTADQIAAGLRELGEAGADEAILVVSPIDERAIPVLAEAIAAV